MWHEAVSVLDAEVGRFRIMENTGLLDCLYAMVRPTFQ